MVTNWRGEREGYIKGEGCRKLREGEETELKRALMVLSLQFSVPRTWRFYRMSENRCSWVFLIRMSKMFVSSHTQSFIRECRDVLKPEEISQPEPFLDRNGTKK